MGGVRGKNVHPPRAHTPHDRAEKAICENIRFYLRKMNSAYNVIIMPFLETLTPINVVKAWEATKHLFLKKNSLLSINIHFSGQPRCQPPPLIC